jgi:hypothetical protein
VVEQGVAETQSDISGRSGQLKSRAKQTGLLDATAWRDAAVAWVVQRLILLGLTYLVIWSAHLKHATVLTVWATVDSAYYAAISQHGYTRLNETPFFPLYPLLERLLTPFSGGNPFVAGIIIANVSCLVAFALLRVLVERECGRGVARRTLLYLTIFPFSFFLAAAYTEALFLALSLGTFLAIRGHHWKVASILATLATLSRPVGILLLVPLVYEYCVSWFRPAGERRFQPKATDIVALLLPILSLVGFDLALAMHFGTPLPIAKAEAGIWYRRLSWPWEGMLWALSSVPASPLVNAVITLLEVTWGFLLVALALAAFWPLRSRPGSWSRLPLIYGLYALASATVVLMMPEDYPGKSLTSIGRYALVVFPVFLVMARAGYKKLWLHRVIFAASLILLVFYAVLFIDGVFVG